MKLIFVGPQASGKGTQAKIIAKKLNIAHISTGDMLRSAEGELKKQVDETINQGRLMPDDLMLKILQERLNKEDCKKGFILDGFPRNINQAKDLDSVTKVDKIIEISISDEEALKRLTGRWNCNKCGIMYNIYTSPKPKQEGICNTCQSALTQREDDKDTESIKKRLEIYHNETEPILEHYESIKINGEQEIEKVTKDILKELN